MTNREVKPLICALMGHLLYIHSAWLNYPVDKLGMLVGLCKIGLQLRLNSFSMESMTHMCVCS